MKHESVKKMTNAAICLALCMALPFFTGEIPQIGKALSPMHIPVLLCGFLCGAPYGLAIGLISPLLRFALFSMPPIFPTGIAMSLELAAYGATTGILYKKLPKTTVNLYVSLICSMLIGRAVWGVAMALIAGVTAVEFSISAFLAGAFLNAIPGIVLHIVLIPVIVLSLQKAGFLSEHSTIRSSRQ